MLVDEIATMEGTADGFAMAVIRENAKGTAGVLVVEPHPVTRRGICGMIDRAPGFRLRGAVGNLAEAIESLGDAAPVQLILVEPLVASGDQPALIGALARVAPGARILALSARVERDFVRRVIEAGVAGFVSKEESLEQVRRAMERVMAGEHVLAGVNGAQS